MEPREFALCEACEASPIMDVSRARDRTADKGEPFTSFTT
jgi:hypothetical protein